MPRATHVAANRANGARVNAATALRLYRNAKRAAREDRESTLTFRQNSVHIAPV